MLRALSRRVSQSSFALVGAIELPPASEHDAFIKALTLAQAQGLSATQAQYAVAVGQFESYLGLKLQWLLPSGEPSYNWGALASFSKSEPSFIGPQGRSWMRFDSMQAGLERFLAIRSVKKALTLVDADGDLNAAVAAMYDGKYWECSKGREACIAEYAKGVLAVANNVAKANGQPLLLNTKQPIPGGAGFPWGTVLFGVIGVGAAAYIFFTDKKSKNVRAVEAGANTAQIASVVTEASS